MKHLAKKFLSDQERERLVRCVEEVEKTTSGEIVPVVISASYHYPTATHLAALTLGIPLALLFCWIIGATNMLAFAAVFLTIYGITLLAVNVKPGLKRPFIARQAMDEEVHEAALVNFYTLGLHRTRDLTGIIILVSVFERKVQILADKGINDKVPPLAWESVAEELTRGIRENRAGEALCAAVRRCGEIIAEHFPIKADDTNELPNLIIEGEPVDPDSRSSS
ncbi:MAG: putative rane protein [Desulfovibrionales bacterium]|jgi:putative membrane protein|nr:putative rane protein [Desulfovibrionales bacterium]